MFNTPFEAFTHVVESLKRQNPADPVTREYLLDVIAPFLANPEQHREHVDVILALAELAGELGASSTALRYFNRTRFDRGVKQHRRREGGRANIHRKITGRLMAIREDLYRRTRPVEITYDALPTKLCTTDGTWQRHAKNAHEIELRVGVRALAGCRVSQVSIALELNGSDEIQIVNARPSDSSEVVADRETTVAYSTKASATSASTFGLEMGPAVLTKPSFGRSRSKSHEREESRKQTRKDRTTQQKVVCVAVGTTASWDIYETPTHMPHGTIAPSVVFLAPVALAIVEFVIRISVRVVGFDPVELAARRNCALTAA